MTDLGLMVAAVGGPGTGHGPEGRDCRRSDRRSRPRTGVPPGKNRDFVLQILRTCLDFAFKSFSQVSFESLFGFFFRLRPSDSPPFSSRNRKNILAKDSQNKPGQNLNRLLKMSYLCTARPGKAARGGHVGTGRCRVTVLVARLVFAEYSLFNIPI